MQKDKPFYKVPIKELELNGRQVKSVVFVLDLILIPFFIFLFINLVSSVPKFPCVQFTHSIVIKGIKLRQSLRYLIFTMLFRTKLNLYMTFNFSNNNEQY